MFSFYQEKSINLTKTGAAERGDFLISFEPHLLDVRSFLFFRMFINRSVEVLGAAGSLRITHYIDMFDIEPLKMLANHPIFCF
jgi:hypothetical protein